MTGSMSASRPSSGVGSRMTSLDRLLAATRTWLEDRLPWYDRDAELAAVQHTEEIREKSIAARRYSEKVRIGDDQLATAVRNTVKAMRR